MFIRFVFCVGSFVSTSSALAGADIYKFTGELVDIGGNENEVAGPLTEGDGFEGTFTYDPDAGSPQFGEVTVTFPAGSFAYQGSLVYVNTQDVSTGFDSLTVVADGDFGDFNFFNFGVEFLDSTATALDSVTGFPPVIDFNDFDEVGFNVNGNQISTGDQFIIFGEVTSVTLVPEPGALVALLLASTAVSRRRARR